MAASGQGSASGSNAQDASLVQAQQLEDRRARAVLAKDMAALDDLLSADLLYCHSNGVIDTKGSYTAAVASPDFHYHLVDVRIDHARQATADVLVMAGALSLEADVRGARVSVRGRILACWRREDGVWRLLALQGAKGD